MLSAAKPALSHEGKPAKKPRRWECGDDARSPPPYFLIIEVFGVLGVFFQKHP